MPDSLTEEAQIPKAIRPFDAFGYRDYRLLLASRLLSLLAMQASFFIFGVQTYALTRSKLAMGNLGIAEVIPVLAIMLLGGQLADTANRRSLLIGSTFFMGLVLAGVALTAITGRETHVTYLITVVLIGLASGIYRPSFQAIEAQALPTEVAIKFSGIRGVIMQAGSVTGPLFGGVLMHFASLGFTFSILAGMVLTSSCIQSFLGPYHAPQKALEEGQMKESFRTSISEGWKLVRTNQALIGSMMLDLFAVLFGGAVALIPVFATDILKVDSFGTSVLASATAVGALVGMGLTSTFNVVRHAGRNLLLSVACFGISILVFAYSHNLWLSAAALAFSGVFDGFSMVIRDVIFRVTVPNELRGRVGAINMMFIGASNEIGAAESGYAAELLGTARSVKAGATLCLGIVGFAWFRLAGLRNFKVEEGTFAEK